jgi:tetratricopeptide (TPR) repeat protein
LAEIYYRANRPADVMELIRGFTAWPGADLFPLVALRRNGYYREPYHGRALGFYAAWAFAGTGKKALAIQTLHDLLCSDMTDDDAYELLNKVEGRKALAFYDELSKFDPYAPRPITWKADLLMRIGQLCKAETLARLAVATDPTDGAAPEGRRLTSYSILARILRAERKNDEAALLEHVVKAVRIGERADLYRDAGLMPQALKLYEQADHTFPDAYCIHARLALVLDNLGKPEEAAEHLKRAYELMPSQFGEIESLCYGCGDTFKDVREQRLARDVFEKMAQDEPNKPQVFYLLGQVYEQQGDFAKALKSLQEAVRLDPHYLNAWNKIVEIASRATMPAAEADQAATAVIRLDPLGLHAGIGSGTIVKSYAVLWRIYALSLAGLPPPRTGPLYPLKRVSNPRVRTPWNLPRQPGDVLRKGPGAALAQFSELTGICGLRDPD